MTNNKSILENEFYEYNEYFEKKMLILKKKLESMSDLELYQYTKLKFRENPTLCCKRTLLIRYILNLERNILNKNK